MWSRVYRYTLITQASFSGMVLLFILASVNYEVVMRYFLNSPTSWVVDFSQYALIYVTFMAGAWVLAREGHVKIEILVERISARHQCLMIVATSIIGALVTGLFCWYSLQVTLEAIRLKALFAGQATVIPKWPVLIVMPIGSLAVSLEFAIRAWRYVRQYKRTNRSHP